MQKKYTIIGRSLTNDELSRFAPEDRLAFGGGVKPIALADLPDEEVFGVLANFGILLAQSDVQCPVGPHDDPGLGTRVAHTCSLGPSRSVAVQCSQGHWAEYPCG
jgi:hypothetical protein